MKVTDAFEGNFIDALALTDGKVTLTIRSYAKPDEVKAKDNRPANGRICDCEDAPCCGCYDTN
tara:strand:- start:73 stop:261 length:189 start_codon:yes stop_codon:yes gene_type:complete